jgi:hypothetical protein
VNEEKLKDLHQKMCQQMAQDLSLAEALTVIQKSIESCVQDVIDKYSEQQKEEAYDYFFGDPEEVEMEVLADGKV